MTRTLIVGAGIAGLVAAIGLARRGHAVTLAERASAFEAVGAGIILSANAAAILEALGVDLAPFSRPLDRMDVTDARGRSLQAIDLAGVREQVGPVWAMSRPDLHNALAGALPPEVGLRLGSTLTALEDGPDGVIATLNDTDGVAHTGRWDLVLAADGLRSIARRLLGQGAPLIHSGDTCWRALVRVPGLDAEPGHAVEAWDNGDRFGVVPLPRDRAYIFLVSPAPEGQAPPPFDILRARFARFQGLPARALAGLSEDGLLHHDLLETSAPAWGTPRVWLLGDAAHGMTPNLGQGAGMAVEDVGALLLALDGGAELAEAHAAWVRTRGPRVAEVQLRSRRMGAVGRLRDGWLRRLRDLVLRATPDALGRATYRAMVGPGVQIARDLRRRQLPGATTHTAETPTSPA